MRIHNARYISDAAVADFNIVPVENFMELVVLMKMFVEKVEKFMGYVCLNVLIVWRVEPGDVPFLFPFGVFFVVGWVIPHSVFISTGL